MILKSLRILYISYDKFFGQFFRRRRKARESYTSFSKERLIKCRITTHKPLISFLFPYFRLAHFTSTLILVSKCKRRLPTKVKKSQCSSEYG